MRTGSARLAAVLLALTALPSAAALAAEPPAVVACAPGYPGTTEEAQPAMDAFAAALGEAAGLGRDGLKAVYHQTEAGGLSRLARPDAAFAFVPLSFFLQHEKALGLSPLAQAVRKGGEAKESWTLVAGKGKLASPAGLDGWQLVSLASYSPRFVRGTALGGWGPVPAGTKLLASGSVLSALRKAAAGEKVALLLDAEQAAGLSSLPFAAQLEVVHRSATVPVSVFCAVGGRAPKPRQKAVAEALRKLDGGSAGASALAGIRVTRFVAVDEASLASARAAFAAAPEGP